jgi:ABC-type phosphate/phosphonate transport system substrate-binding protein
MSRTIWVGAVAYDPKVVTIWEGMRRYFHEEAILPVGDTGTSEVEVVRAVLDGRADAGAIGSPFWKTLRSEHLAPEGALTEVWTSPPYNHCMFTARPDLAPTLGQRFAEGLSGMSYDQSQTPCRA